MATKEHWSDHGDGADCPHTQCSRCERDIIQTIPNTTPIKAWWFNSETADVVPELIPAWGLRRNGDAVPMILDGGGLTALDDLSHGGYIVSDAAPSADDFPKK